MGSKNYVQEHVREKGALSAINSEFLSGIARPRLLLEKIFQIVPISGYGRTYKNVLGSVASQTGSHKEGGRDSKR